ncbi:MAG TPA: PadR family transcriptional regulator [Actinomycetota bacterium]
MFALVSKVEVVILGLLAEEPLYGYELLERFRDRGMGSWVEIGKASVYQALRRLEGQARIAGRAQEGAEGPDRRVYRITRSGRGLLRTGLVERFAVAGPYETGAGLSLGFLHLISLEDAREGVAERAAALEARRAAIAAERERLSAGKGPARAAGLRLVGLQEAFIDAELAWLATFRRDLAKLRR